MKISQIIIFFGLIALSFSTDLSSAFIKGEIQDKLIENIMRDEFLTLVEKTLPCIELETFSEAISKPLLKLVATVEKFRFTNIVLPKDQYSIKMYHGATALDVAKLRCEEENSQGCELQDGAYYPKCKVNFEGKGTECEPKCPAHFGDIGISCSKPAPYGRGDGYPWHFGDGWTLQKAKERCEKAHPDLGCEKWGEIYYPKCKEDFHNVACCICSPNCPAGFHDDGEFCRKPSKYSRKEYKDVDNNVITTIEDNFTADLEGLISVEVDGIHVLTNAKVTAKTHGSNFYGRLGMGMKNGSLQFNFEKTVVELNNLDIQIHGSLTAEILDALLKLLNGVVKYEIQNLIDSLGKTLEPAMNKALMSLPKKFDIGSAGLEIEYNLLEAPETASDKVTFYLDGTVNFIPKTPTIVQPLQNSQTPKLKFEKDDNVLLQVNQNGINEILAHAFNAGILQFQEDVNTTQMGIEVKHANISVVEYAPKLEIVDKEIKANVAIQLNTTMKQGVTAEFKNYSLTVYADPEVSISIKDNGLKIEILNITIVDIKGPMPAEMGMPKEFFLALLKGILQGMIPQINAAIPLIKIPTFAGVTFNSNYVELDKDQFVFETDITYTDELYKFLEDIILKAIEDAKVQAIVPIENICKKSDTFYSQ